MPKVGRFQFSTDPAHNPKSLEELLAIPAADLPFCDGARLNLICALGLPGTENLDIDRCIHTIDKWTNRVEFETRRHLYRAKDPRFAARYGGSKAKLSAEMLSQVLQEDCGVKYNPKRIIDPDFRNCKDVFIHGMIDDPNGGTCCSMPVLYAAVARRLRYPVKLVHANAHLFCRWDGKETRFNIEGTGKGLSFFPDEYYRRSSSAGRIPGLVDAGTRTGGLLRLSGVVP
jgi:Transglutaminase-like superfamily